MNTADKHSPGFIDRVMLSLCGDGSGADCELIETHISWVILAGDRAYKIKKPVDLGFLDFSTLEKRAFYCEEELRLNRRFAADLYLAVLPITGTEQHPVVSAEDEAIEYAVQMRRFPQSAQLDHLLASGELSDDKLLAVACLIAGFHADAAVADAASRHGEPEHILSPVQENFSQIRTHCADPDALSQLDRLAHWSETRYQALLPLFRQRKAGGFIRECHGDLHLRNLAWFEDKPLAFDCLEFDPELRWIDVISELAFLVMDLQSRGESGMAQLVLNRYLEQTGDYAGCRLLPFYLSYRALVRAKVDAIRAGQPGIDAEEKAEAQAAFDGYLALAGSYAGPSRARLMINHGPSASGKTTLSGKLAQALRAIRIRSDVERKRLAGLSALSDGHDEVGAGLYSAQHSQQTYSRLVELCTAVLEAGYPVIVDAAFLDPQHRQLFRQLALRLGCPFHILSFTASAETLRQRIQARRDDASDADLAVLEHQLESYRPLDEQEQACTLGIDTEQAFDAAMLARRIEAGPG